MHRNYRRKKPKHNPRRNGPGWRWSGIQSWMKREFWQKYRAQERTLLDRARHDDFVDRIPRSILYTYG